MGVLKHAWANFRDDSFIAQYLSPHLMRKMQLFKLADRAADPDYRVAAIHDERGYKEVRRALASQYDPGRATQHPGTAPTWPATAGLASPTGMNNEVPLAERTPGPCWAMSPTCGDSMSNCAASIADDAERYSYRTSPLRPRAPALDHEKPARR